MNLLHHLHHHRRPLTIPLLLLSLLLLSPHPAHASAPAIDPTTTPGFASLDTCIQLCFTGGSHLSAHSFGARIGCATKACVCDAEAAAAVEEYMETCESVSCAKPRRLEWWKRGAWKKIFARYCEGVWGSEVEVEGGVEGW